MSIEIPGGQTAQRISLSEMVTPCIMYTVTFVILHPMLRGSFTSWNTTLTISDTSSSRVMRFQAVSFPALLAR
ncbi:hypothetical protein NL676_020889 [Syzygium grande]|nr:hypothetical protein NL676_020889 [Syzygium grande]